MAVLVHICMRAFLCYIVESFKIYHHSDSGRCLLQAVNSVTLARKYFLYTFQFFHRLYMYRGIRNGGNVS